MASLRDRFEASLDPLRGRRMLDSIETGVWPAARGQRRVVARFGVAARSRRPPEMPAPECSTVGEERIGTACATPTSGVKLRQRAATNYRSDPIGRFDFQRRTR